jgi:hypothetical protein
MNNELSEEEKKLVEEEIPYWLNRKKYLKIHKEGSEEEKKLFEKEIAYWLNRKKYEREYYKKNQPKLRKQMNDWRNKKLAPIRAEKVRLKAEKKAEEARIKAEKKAERKALSKLKKKGEYKLRCAKDPTYKLRKNLSREMRRFLKGCEGYRNLDKSVGKWELVGYTPREFINHIKGLFLPGMTMENYGKVWHIDHIEPICSFPETVEGMIAFSQLSNLRPLWAEENLLKGNRYDKKKSLKLKK